MIRVVPVLVRRASVAFPGLVCLCVLLLSVGSTRVVYAQASGLGPPSTRHFPQMPGTPPASAAGPGKIRLTTADGEHGPVVLAAKKAAFVGEIVVWNDGPGPLGVSRVALRTDLDDPRLPPHITVRFADGSAGGTVIAPHSSKRVAITWTPDHDAKLRQAVGHVVLTSTDEDAGEVAMGFQGDMPGSFSPVTSHLLSWLLFLPLAGALAAFFVHVTGSLDAVRVRRAALGLSLVQCLLALVLFAGFNNAVTRGDGNDGFQFLERFVWIRSVSVEFFVGVDGTSVALVLLTAVVGLVAAIASYRVQDRFVAHYGLLSLLLAGVMGVFVALDLSLLVVAWATMLIALVGLLAVSGNRAAARTLAAYGGVSVACLAFAVTVLFQRSDPTFLADGSRVPHTFAIPELMRVAYNAKHLTLFGLHWVKVVWTALFLAFAVMIPVVPFQSWFVRLVGGVAESVTTPVAVVVAGLVVRTGVYGLLRVSMAILPDGSRWAATTLVAFGVLNIGVGGVACVLQKDLRRVIASAAVAQIGFCLVGLGSMTREGLAGSLLQLVSQGLVGVVVVLLVAVFFERAKTCNVGDLAAYRASMPAGATLVAIALVASSGMPGLVAFWGELIPAFGAFPVQRVLAGAAVCGAVLVAFGQLSAVRGLLQAPGQGEPKEPTNKLAPSALHPRELSVVVALLLVCLALGLFPGSFLTLVQGGVFDLNILVNPQGPDEIA